MHTYAVCQESTTASHYYDLENDLLSRIGEALHARPRSQADLLEVALQGLVVTTAQDKFDMDSF